MVKNLKKGGSSILGRVDTFYDSQEGLKMASSRQKETGKSKMTLRKSFEGDFKNMELTWETAEREAKERHSLRKRSSYIILNG